MGVLASLSNPYWTLWWATIGLGYLVSAARMGIPGITVFFLGHISGDLFWYSAVSYGVSHGKRILSDLSYQRVIRACGVFLLGFGGWFLASGKTYLLVGTP
jgi:threonine/homoserine/homoserine lactone efflux protein